MKRGTQFKELAHAIMEASAGWDVRLETQGRADVAVQVQRSSASPIPSHLGGVYLFFCSGPTYIYRGPSALLRVHPI